MSFPLYNFELPILLIRTYSIINNSYQYDAELGEIDGCTLEHFSGLGVVKNGFDANISTNKIRRRKNVLRWKRKSISTLNIRLSRVGVSCKSALAPTLILHNMPLILSSFFLSQEKRKDPNIYFAIKFWKKYIFSE